MVPMSLYRVLLVAAGGAAGSALRYLAIETVKSQLGADFPWGTLAVNALGSFLLGAILAASAPGGPISSDARLLLGTGVMGGFTTCSTFSAESFALLEGGRWGAFLANVSLTSLGCVAMAAAGSAVVRGLSWGQGG